MEPSKSLQIGKYTIPQPCPVPWDEMDALDGRNRHCAQCSQVVHDLTGKSLCEIDALYAANEGKLCGNITVDELGNPLYFKGTESKRKVIYLKHLAAAASLFFLYQTPQANSFDSKARKYRSDTEQSIQIHPPGTGIVPTEATNTLVTGVVLTQSGYETEDSLRIEIRSGGKQIAQGFTSNGLFHFDLEGKLKPEDEIKVVVEGARFDLGVRYHDRKYGGTELATTLGKSQNLTLTVKYDAPERMPMKLGGAVVRRDDL